MIQKIKLLFGITPPLMKQVIVMRTDLNMRKGKMIAQGSHASLKVVLENKRHRWVKQWLHQSFTKIVVKAQTIDELKQVYADAMTKQIPVAWITDAGRTEFNGVPTDTCIAVGPAPVDLINTVTGHLKLL